MRDDLLDLSEKCGTIVGNITNTLPSFVIAKSAHADRINTLKKIMLRKRLMKNTKSRSLM